MTARETRELVATAIAREASTSGGYVLASLLADHVLEHSLDPSMPGWENELLSAVGERFDAVLAATPPLVREDRQLGMAAHDLVAALAFAEGTGLPSRDVWPAVATAIGGADVQYRRGDALWALDEFGRYIVESGEDGQAAYRLFHPLLVRHVRRNAGDGAPERIAVRLLDLFFDQTVGGEQPERANPYLLRHLPAHLAAAGPEGWRLLDELVGRVPELAVPAFRALELRSAELAVEHKPEQAAGALLAALDLGRRNERIELPERERRLLAIDIARYAHEARRDDIAVDFAGLLAEALINEANEDVATVNMLVEAATIAAVALAGRERPKDALQLAERALDRTKALDPSDPIATEIMIRARTTVANRLAFVERFHDALTMSLDALVLAERLWRLDAAEHAATYVSAQYNLSARWVGLGEFEAARQAVDRALRVTIEQQRSPFMRDSYRRLLGQRVALDRELNAMQDGIADMWRLGEALVDEWLEIPSLAGRLRLLEREVGSPEKAQLVLDVVRRRLDGVAWDSEAAAQLEGLAGAVELWAADPTEAARLLRRPPDLGAAADAQTDPRRRLALWRAVLAAGRAGTEAWSGIADAKRASGDEQGALRARAWAERAARRRAAPPE